jgi:hypothetical protein
LYISVFMCTALIAVSRARPMLLLSERVVIFSLIHHLFSP